MDGIGKDRLRAAPNVFFENHSSKVLKSRFLCHKLWEQTLAADEYFWLIGMMSCLAICGVYVENKYSIYLQ